MTVRLRLRRRGKPPVRPPRWPTSLHVCSPSKGPPPPPISQAGESHLGQKVLWHICPVTLPRWSCGPRMTRAISSEGSGSSLHRPEREPLGMTGPSGRRRHLDQSRASLRDCAVLVTAFMWPRGRKPRLACGLQQGLMSGQSLAGPASRPHLCRWIALSFFVQIETRQDPLRMASGPV